MVTSRREGANPNIWTSTVHAPPARSSNVKRPDSSVLVTTLFEPCVAVTVAPGMGWPPERTNPEYCPATRLPARKKKTKVDRNCLRKPS